MNYVIKTADTLKGIACTYRVSVESLLTANPLLKTKKKIVVGSVINIPPPDNFERPTFCGGNRPAFGGGNRPTNAGAPPDDLGLLNGGIASALPIVANTTSLISNSRIYNRSIRIKGMDSFVRRVRSELDEIAKSAIGARLVGTKGSSSKNASDPAWRNKFQVVISEGKTCRSIPIHVLNGWKKDKYIDYDHLGLPISHGNKGTGLGCGTNIEYNPAQVLPKEVYFVKIPRALVLAHELIHAYLYARGDADPEMKNKIRNHELQVVGLSPFESGEITENKLRAQWKPKQPRRSRYIRLTPT